MSVPCPSGVDRQLSLVPKEFALHHALFLQLCPMYSSVPIFLCLIVTANNQQLLEPVIIFFNVAKERKDTGCYIKY